MVIKVDQQLPASAAVNTKPRRPQVAALGLKASSRSSTQTPAPAPARSRQNPSFTLQLNQQLTSMQTANGYLDELYSRLSQLKLRLSREVGSTQASSRVELESQMQSVRELLEQRSTRSGQALDGRLRLSLNEPVRSQFTLQGFDSIESIQQAGKETLLFSAGRKLSEPLSVVLDEGLNGQQILSRFNNGLSAAGLRAELDVDGALKFSAREADWQALKHELKVQGEGRLAAKSATAVASQEEQLLRLPEASQLDSARELRQVLDEVVAALERVSSLREQLGLRQNEVREFLRKHANEDEQQWAQGFAAEVYQLLSGSLGHYSAVSQTVVAQSSISRFSVVSMLS